MLTTSITLRNLALAGVAGEIVFELYAWLISPILFGVPSPQRILCLL